MALKAAAVVMYMLLSGCRASPYIDENGWAPANDQGRGMFAEEDAVRVRIGRVRTQLRVMTIVRE